MSVDPRIFELERLSSGVVDALARGRLDAAERGCRELKRRFPEMIDWMDCSASVLEARGDFRGAAEHYRMCLKYIEKHPEDFDRDSTDWYRGEVSRLESRRMSRTANIGYDHY